MPFKSRFGDQPRFGLAAWTAIVGVMRAYKNIVQAKHLAQHGMDPVQFAAGQRSVRQTGLVGGGDEQETRGFELAQWLYRLGLRLHLFQEQRRHRLVSFHPVQV